MNEKHVGLLGATSLVGKYLQQSLTLAEWQVTAFSRHDVNQSTHNVTWERIAPLSDAPGDKAKIPYWICAAPIWLLPPYLDSMASRGARRIVALSSTSRFTKSDSHDLEEQAIACRLADAEEHFRRWAEDKSIEWVILRPTLIYGFGQDKNISEIIQFIRRFGFFPLLGKANGLRQPVHTGDVGNACLTALASCATNRAYNLSGAETLTYRNMVTRVFVALGRRPRLLTIPLWAFSLALSLLRRLPRYRQWSTSMVVRMNCDLVFDHSEAERDLNFKPRAFMLETGDLPA
jgi:nucleoside-diphosphate-sugar epimerase